MSQDFKITSARNETDIDCRYGFIRVSREVYNTDAFDLFLAALELTSLAVLTDAVRGLGGSRR